MEKCNPNFDHRDCVIYQQGSCGNHYYLLLKYDDEFRYKLIVDGHIIDAKEDYRIISYIANIMGRVFTAVLM